LRIRVYTLSGHIVREFDIVENPSLLDSGGLRIGWNKLTWDGTDEDGDPLATGVYLYKVFMRAEGQKIEVNNDAGLEKLVVLR
jgi:flagellar hook assembly protein FlgD